MNVIEFFNVWEKYQIKFVHEKRVSWQEIWALKDINLTVAKGQVLGLVGENGAGKTTLLKLISGRLVPDRGTINVQGKVSLLMELGAGFNPDFTGRENILLNAQAYGLTGGRLKSQIDKIIDFADLGKFIDALVKYYSQGMFMRLAFALAVFIEPEILLIDDILAVGDEYTQKKCSQKIFEFKNSGKTIVVVSHDMGMVNKLCDRVCVLDKGKIVKDDTVKNSVSFYMARVGKEKGIVSLKEKDAEVIFNNGKLMINYKDNFLTSSKAGYLAFFDSLLNRWLSSVDFSWEVKEKSDITVVIEGVYKQGRIGNRWELSLKQGQVDINMTLIDPDNRLKSPHIDMSISSLYKYWKGLDRNGVFSGFLAKQEWEKIGSFSFFQGVLGVYSKEEKELPCLVFQREDGVGNISLYNTGYQEESRILQWGLKNNKELKLKILLFNEQDDLSGYIKAKKSQSFDLEKQKTNPFKNQEIIISGEYRLIADSKDKVIRIYQNQDEITSPYGLYGEVSISKRDKRYISKDSDWNVTKISRDRLKINFEYEDFSQAWEMFFSQSGQLKVRIETDTKDNVIILSQDLKLELKNNYNQWQTRLQEGDFSLSELVGNIYPVRLRDNRVQEVVLKDNSYKIGPKSIYFKEVSNPGHHIMSLYKRIDSDDNKYLCINSSVIIPNDIKLKDYLSFQGEFVFDKDVKLEKACSTKEGIKIKEKDLALIFDRGRAHILWKEKKLTKGLGLYTSIRSSGVWVDSSQGSWNIGQVIKNKMNVTGKWAHIPISQDWQINIIDKDEFEFIVKINVYEDTNIELMQTCIMCVSDYKFWKIPGKEKEVFLNEYTNIYDILPFRFWYGKTDKIMAVSGKNLPSLSFENHLGSEKYCGIIENTDDLYKARLLQYQQAYNLKQGDYLYFKGGVKIEPQE